MTNYSLEEFKAWLAGDPSRLIGRSKREWNDKLKLFDPTISDQRLTSQEKQELFNHFVEGTKKPGTIYDFAKNDLWIDYSLVAQKWRLKKQLSTQINDFNLLQTNLFQLREQKTANEKDFKRQLNQAQSKITELEAQICNHEQSQELAQHERELNIARQALNTSQTNLTNTLQSLQDLQQDNQSLKEKLVEAEQKYQNHLTQEKAQLSQEIQLIKGVLT